MNRNCDSSGIGIGSSLDDTREVVLPSLGEAGEVFNAVVTSLLNAVTIYKYQLVSYKLGLTVGVKI